MSHPPIRDERTTASPEMAQLIVRVLTCRGNWPERVTFTSEGSKVRVHCDKRFGNYLHLRIINVIEGICWTAIDFNLKP